MQDPDALIPFYADQGGAWDPVADVYAPLAQQYYHNNPQFAPDNLDRSLADSVRALANLWTQSPPPLTPSRPAPLPASPTPSPTLSPLGYQQQGLFPNGQAPGMGRLPSLVRLDNTGFGQWDGNAGRPGADGQMGAAGNQPARGPNGMDNLLARHAANVADARQRALADRAQAVQAAGRMQAQVNGPAMQQFAGAVNRLRSDPYSPEVINYLLGRQQDQQAAQFNAAISVLQQQYAQAGKALDPRTVALLRMQMARQGNGERRDLMLAATDRNQSARQAYAAATQGFAGLEGSLQGDAARVLANILADTSYQTGNAELNQLLQLAQMAAYTRQLPAAA